MGILKKIAPLALALSTVACNPFDETVGGEEKILAEVKRILVTSCSPENAPKTGFSNVCECVRYVHSEGRGGSTQVALEAGAAASACRAILDERTWEGF